MLKDPTGIQAAQARLGERLQDKSSGFFNNKRQGQRGGRKRPTDKERETER